MSIALRHPHTGDIKVLPEGWSWGCFLGSFFLGIPLFRRGLQVWGAVMVVFNISLMVTDAVPTDSAATLYLWLTVIGGGLCLFLGFRANQMAIDRYRSLGWQDAGALRKFF